MFSLFSFVSHFHELFLQAIGRDSEFCQLQLQCCDRNRDESHLGLDT